MKKFLIEKIKFKKLLYALCLILFVASGNACAVTKGEFLEGLLNARGIEFNTENTQIASQDKTTQSEKKISKAELMLKAGIVTDNVNNLNENITRREALRWCIQSLGLAFEADVMSDFNFNYDFKDIGNFTRFERGCLGVAINMKPQLLASSEKFNGNQVLNSKEMNIFLERVKTASSGLELDLNVTLEEGITLLIHRDGVFSGVPKWRVFADGFDDKEEAENAQKFFKSRGYEMSAIHPLYEWFLRTSVLDDYAEVRKLLNLIKNRNLSPRIIPSFTNPKTEILPRYWVMLIIDPEYWQMTPLLIPNEGGKVLAPLSEIINSNRNKNIRAAINAGFFAMTKKRHGYPIGILKAGGEKFSEPYAGRSCLGWNNYNNENDEIEAMLGIYNSDWDGLENIIQAGPMIIEDGQPRADLESFNNKLLSARHPRSVVGITHDGFWFFMAVDGRNGLHASGATISELTEILLKYGVQYALNLDGGGSTEIIINNRIENAPSEGKERPISYGLGIMPTN